MFAIIITEKGGKKQRVEFDEQSITVGRVQGNHVVLTRGNVSKEHCRISFRAGEFTLEDLGSTNGTYVNGRKIAGPTTVSSDDKIYVGEFILGVEAAVSEDVSSAARPGAPPSPSVPSPPRPRIKVQPPATPAHSPLPAMAASPPVSPPLPVAHVEAPPPKSSMGRPAKSGHLTHLLDYAAIEIKRIDRAHLPCALDEGTAGHLRIVLRGLIDDLAHRGKLGPGDHPRAMLAEAFLAIVDLGPLNHWLADPDIVEIRLPGDGSAWLRRASGWATAVETIAPESLSAFLRSLGAALPGIEESGIPGLVRYRLESGALVVVQFPPVCASTSAVIYKNIASFPEESGAVLQTLSGPVKSALKSAVTDHRRIAVVGPSGPCRLSVLTEILDLLPADQLVVTVEDLPLLGTRRGVHLALAAGSADRAVAVTDGVRSLFTRATDLRPEWIVTRSVRWTDVPELLAMSSSRPGVIAELPAGGFQSLDRELMAGILVSGAAITIAQASQLLAAAFDFIVITGTSAIGSPVVTGILQVQSSDTQWKPVVLYSV